MSYNPPKARGFPQTVLAYLSVRFRRHVESCIDLRAVTDDPLHAVYLSPEAPFLIDIAGTACLGLHSMAFPMDPDSVHPFIRTVRAIREGLADYDASPLCGYYASFRPATAAEAVGIPEASAHPEMLRPAIAASLPWDFRSPAQSQEFWTAVCARDYREHGFGLDSSHGWKSWGPVSAMAGQAEFSRLDRACRSIGALGYRRHPAHDGDIQGTLLRHGTETRVLLSSGQHRAAVLAGLGHRTLPVRLTSAVVNRDDVARWPNVERGFYTVPLALRVFDRVFAGLQPFGQATGRLRTVG